MNVLRVVTAFESKRIVTVRADTVAGACEKIPVEMPHVVLMLVPFADEYERDALNDRAAAVGALVVYIDPLLENEPFKELLEATVHAAIERKLQLEADQAQAQASAISDTSPPDEVDAGWNE